MTKSKQNIEEKKKVRETTEIDRTKIKDIQFFTFDLSFCRKTKTDHAIAELYVSSYELFLPALAADSVV